MDYEGQNVEIVHRDVTVKETVKKQAFQLIKISEDGDQTETDLVQGAGFKVFLISDLSGVKDGSLKPSGEDFVPEDLSAMIMQKIKQRLTGKTEKKFMCRNSLLIKKGMYAARNFPMENMWYLKVPHQRIFRPQSISCND